MITHDDELFILGMPGGFPSFEYVPFPRSYWVACMKSETMFAQVIY